LPVGVSANPFPDGIEYAPDPGSPDAQSGKCGCNLVSWGAGAASVEFDFGSLVRLPRAGDYRITAYVDVNGMFYTYSRSPYVPAVAQLVFRVWADDVMLAPDYFPSASTTLLGKLALDDRNWDFFGGRFSVSTTFVAGDAPIDYVVGVSLTASVSAAQSDSAGLNYHAAVGGIEVDLGS
jgi:hypothetical protein